MEIVILCEYDFSGNMYNLAQSVNRHTEHHAIAIKRHINERLKYPTMFLASDDKLDEATEIIYSADAIVFKELPSVPKTFRIRPSKITGKKKVVILGGGGYRYEELRKQNFEVYNKKIHSVKWATSSLDFIEKNPKWSWIPASILVDDLRRKYDYSKKNPPIIACSPSTHTDNTQHVRSQFNRIMKILEEEWNLMFQHRTIFGVDNETCLTRKAHASIFFDRIFDIYGINSQEASAFESAIITGSSPFVRRFLSNEKYGCPFIFVDTVDEAAKEMLHLIKNQDEMKRLGQQCYEYVNRVHSGKLAAENLVETLR